jgi:L-ascorbate metabolism protein UlaG (beta-lactamase superfamily)
MNAARDFSRNSHVRLMTASLLFFAFNLVAEIPISARTADRFAAAQGDIKITPLLHSSVQIEHAGKVIQVDPWSTADLSLAKPADVILITDDPVHHLDVKAIERLRKPGAPVIIPAVGKSKVPDGVVLANGESTTAAGIRIDAIAAYDVTGPPFSHPKGKGNGYVVTLGGKRVYLAGVGECTPEMQALKDIDVAFMSMNIPVTRMTPAATAACVKTFKPKVVYIYHYDQDTAARLENPSAPRLPGGLADGLSAPQSLQAFKDAMRGESIELRIRDWYSQSRP